MTWQPHQQYRLAQENYLIRTEMPDFAFNDPTGYTYVRGTWQSQKGNYYTIRIYLPPGYPDACPRTYIEYPAPLLDYHGRHVTSHLESHYYHTWETDWPGFVQVCTYRPEYWNPASTVVQLIHKAFLWIIAYEEHRATGKDIKDLLLDM